MRARQDAQEFAKHVRDIGIGKKKKNVPEGYVKLPEKICTDQPITEKIFKPIFE